MQVHPRFHTVRFNQEMFQERELCAGPVSGLWQPQGLFLRRLRAGRVEILRGIYPAVRDSGWGTLVPRIRKYEVEAGNRSFAVTMKVSWHEEPVHLEAEIILSGDQEGVIRYHFEGEACSDFKANRIGFCVLHPDSAAGNPVQIEHVDGIVEHGEFPKCISPSQPFKDIRALLHEPSGAGVVEVRMEGETFEMEDQRNWSDASFKTYCTPLDLPAPQAYSTGDRVVQTVTLRFKADTPFPTAPSISPKVRETILLRPDMDRLLTLPDIGFEYRAGSGSSLDSFRYRLLGDTKPAHLRLNLEGDRDNWRILLLEAREVAARLNAGLEIAVFLRGDGVEDLQILKQAVDSTAPKIARWIILHEEIATTGPRWIKLFREHLGTSDSRTPIGIGTDAFFTELNRDRPPAGSADFLAYSLNPQVHAFDDLSLMESLAMHAECINSARQFSGSSRIVVSPVTLKMRWNPTGGRRVVLPDYQCLDERLYSQISAAWTFGSICMLSVGGALAGTYFRTHGELGIMSAGTDSPDVYPVHGVFKLVADIRKDSLYPLQSSDPEKVVGLMGRRGGRSRFFCVNLTDNCRKIEVACDGNRIRKTLEPYSVEALSLET